jgi:hypothetical protein
MLKPTQTEKEERKNKNKKSMSNEEIKKLVDFAIAQNPLVYKRLSEI